MYNIKHINIKGFRRLYNLDLPIQPFSVIIGPNTVGKTSFLDAFSLLAASASGRLNIKLSLLGGINNILTRGLSNDIVFTVLLDYMESYSIEYSLQLTPMGTFYSIINESLKKFDPEYMAPLNLIYSSMQNIQFFDPNNKIIVPINWEHDYQETSLSQIPRTYKEHYELKNKLSNISKYHLLDTGPLAPLKLPQQMRPANGPGINGEDLVAYLFYLRETEKDKFELIEDSLKAAFPDLEEISFPPVAAGMLSLTWKDKNFSKPLYIHELSEGVLRFLWLSTLLQSNELPAVTMIDEPDTSLHPELMNILIDLMREASNRTQLIVTTHSDRFIRFLEPHELLVFDLDDDGFTSARRGDSFDLDDWLSHYRLDELWMKGLFN